MVKPSTPSIAPAPGGYHHGNLREALIEACRAAMAQAASSDGVSLRELARQVGVTPNAAYRHFASKDELLQAVAARGFRELQVRSLQARESHPEPVPAFRAAGRAYVDFAREHPALFRLMFGKKQPEGLSPELAEAGAQAFQEVVNLAVTVTGHPASDPRTLTAAISAWSVVHGLAHLALDGQLTYMTGDESGAIDLVLDQFRLRDMDGVAAPGSTPSKGARAKPAAPKKRTG